MKISVSSKVAAQILLGVNVILLCVSAFILMVILLENSPDLYERIYDATYVIQRLIIFSWFIALALSPVLAITLSLCFGLDVRKTVHWKISIVIMAVAGLPSLAFLGVGFAMRGI
jgi:hypothetical protein